VADPGRGRGVPSSEAEPARGKCVPSSGVVPARRECCPSSGAKLVRGDPFVGRLDGPSESLWAVSCMVRHLHG
jgi:hypothetical protein